MTQILHFFAQLLCNIILKPFIKVAALPKPLPIDTQQHFVFIAAKAYAADELAIKTCLKNLQIEHFQLLFMPKEKATARKQQDKFRAELQRAKQQENSIILPISIFWGRSPRKVKSVWQAYLSNSWAVPGMIKRRIIVLLQVRHVFCYFGQAVDISSAETSDELIALLKLQFSKQKEAVIGPDLSHRRILSQQVLQSTAVQSCIDELASNDDQLRAEENKKAQKYLNEMASDYSYPVVRVFDVLLSWLWEKLYSGVEISGMEKLLAIAEDHELVYVPCHRSHIDYLLLSYVIFHKGLMPPHIAAGLNLNLPIVGSLLRRAGAFFIRRQFRDNKLYRAVLESYVATMCQQGFSIEYFIEGGRSRTGFLLPPKPGMLAMTLRAAQNQTQRPLAFIPVYIGYERLLESHSYINELYGEKKQSESLFSLFSARRYLKEDFGKVHLSIGEAIFPNDIWQSLDAELVTNASPKPDSGELFFQCVDKLGQQIQIEVNKSASLSPLNFIATALLGSQRKALIESQLLLQIDLLQSLTQLPIYAQSIQIETFNHSQAIERALSLKLIQKNPNTLGDIYFMDQKAQVSATFLRNNSLHVFILPALVASIFINVERAGFKRIHEVCSRLYPYIQAEFFLPWQPAELEPVIQRIISHFLNLGLIKETNNSYQAYTQESEQFHALMILSGACKASIERFYISNQLLSTAAAGFYTRQSLEDACVKTAERLSLLHEFHAPDFFDKNLFRTFIASLIKEGLVTEEQQQLHYQPSFITAKKLSKYLLNPSVKRSIQQITPTIPSGATLS